MGYCYTTGGALCCDRCDSAVNVRKRHCPHKAGGLPYCPAPALCKDCWERLGKNKIHDRCKPMAEAQNIKYAERSRRMAAGDLERQTAWGDWHQDVPKGMVAVAFRNDNGAEQFVLLPGDTYADADWFSDLTDPKIIQQPS